MNPGYNQQFFITKFDCIVKLQFDMDLSIPGLHVLSDMLKHLKQLMTFQGTDKFRHICCNYSPFHFHLHWKMLNVITLGQTYTEY